MRVFEAAALLVVGTALLTFFAVSHLLFPHPLTLSNPGLFMEGLLGAGVVFVAIAARKLIHVHHAASGKDSV